MRTRIPWFLALFLVTFGCGGGGSTVVTDGTVTYVANWLEGGPVNGQSQVITVTNGAGTSLITKIFNKAGTGVSSTELGKLSNGTYRLRADLFSSANGQGTRVGVLESDLVVNGAATYRVDVGGSVASLTVSPTTAQFQVRQSQRFTATAQTSSGAATFLRPGSLTWEALGGVATVNEEGIATGVQQGSGSIRATDADSGKTGAAAIMVDPFITAKSKWTIIVFMNAANDLYQYSSLNMNQMEQVAGNPDVRFVVQWKQSKNLFAGSTFSGTRRYLVKFDTTDTIASELVQDMGEGIDMGKPQTSSDFIAWVQTYYPADKYGFIFWNHGAGWKRGPEEMGRGVSYDDETGSAIMTWELNAALGNKNFEFLAWDASLMQMLEVAYEVKDRTPLVAGSEESPPGEGYPYHLIFDDWRDNPDASTRDLTKAFVDGMLAVEDYVNRKITQSVLDTSKFPNLVTAVDALADDLALNKTTLATAIKNARDTAQSYSPRTNRFYRDLIDLCRILVADATVPAGTKSLAAAVIAAAQAAIVHEGHNANSANSAGISIDFSPADVFTSLASDYSKLKFAADSRWDEWLSVAP
ncbi:MAG: hypothetical protein HONBIEJF_01006 [Fimbriimonadaceae bacterium]|nr:hypothetical protein [Fimbriimonadaceae bacterium]